MKVIKIVIVLLMLGAGLFLFFRLKSVVKQPLMHTISISESAQNGIHFFSKLMISTLKEFAAKQEKNALTPAAFIALFHKTFPALVTDIKIQIVQEKARVSLIAVQPLYLINQEYILSSFAKADFIKKESFDASVLASLKMIDVAPNQNLSQLSDSFFSFIQKIDDALFKHYSIVWQNEHAISFRDLTQKKFVMLCSYETKINDQLLKAVGLIKNELFEGVEKKGKVWIADVRFKNQIVVFGQGGNGDEKGIRS